MNFIYVFEAILSDSFNLIIANSTKIVHKICTCHLLSERYLTVISNDTSS